MRLILPMFCLLILVAVSVPADQPIDFLDYYRLHFEEKKTHPLADSLFEKTVWERKVSHLLLDERSGAYRVTLLMIQPYPHNWKSVNYPIWYEFRDLKEALTKLHWMDSFLVRRGVLRVKLEGSRIVSEKILFPGYSDQKAP